MIIELQNCQVEVSLVFEREPVTLPLCGLRGTCESRIWPPIMPMREQSKWQRCR